MLVHAPKPIGQPAGAGFEKDHLQLGISLQRSATNEAQTREHLLERMRNRMGEKPLPGETIGAGGGQKRAGAFMNQQWDGQLDDGSVERVIIGIIDIAAFDRIRPDEDAFEAELIDGSPGFLDGELHVLDWDYADAHESFGIRVA